MLTSLNTGLTCQHYSNPGPTTVDSFRSYPNALRVGVAGLLEAPAAWDAEVDGVKIPTACRAQLARLGLLCRIDSLEVLHLPGGCPNWTGAISKSQRSERAFHPTPDGAEE